MHFIFYVVFNYMCACGLYGVCAHVYSCLQSPEGGTGFSAAELTGVWEPSNMGTEH